MQWTFTPSCPTHGMPQYADWVRKVEEAAMLPHQCDTNGKLSYTEGIVPQPLLVKIRPLCTTWVIQKVWGRQKNPVQTQMKGGGEVYSLQAEWSGAVWQGCSYHTPTSSKPLWDLLVNTNLSETFLLVNTRIYFMYNVSDPPPILIFFWGLRIFHMFWTFEIFFPVFQSLLPSGSRSGGFKVSLLRAPLVRLSKSSLTCFFSLPPSSSSTSLLCSF